MKKPAKNFAIIAAVLSIAATSYGQYDPDPDIYDAGRNGAGNDNGSGDGNRTNVNISGLPGVALPGIPIGGSISVIDESQLPPIGEGIELPIPINGSGVIPGNNPNISISGPSSSGLPIPIMGGGSMGGQESTIPMPMPMPPSSGNPSGQQQGMPPMNLPPPPGQLPIGDPSQQIGALPGDFENISPEEQGAEQSSSNSKGAKSGPKSGSQSEKSQDSDNQEMPDNIGGGQSGGTSRGTGTEEGVRIPKGL